MADQQEQDIRQQEEEQEEVIELKEEQEEGQEENGVEHGDQTMETSPPETSGPSIEASKKTLRNVAALSSPFKWKARTPTPHPKKLTDKEKEDLAKKMETGVIGEADDGGEDNKGFKADDADPEIGAGEGEPELVDEEKPPRLDCYYVTLAVVLAAAVLSVILYFIISSVMTQPVPLVEDLTTAENSPLEGGPEGVNSTSIFNLTVDENQTLGTTSRINTENGLHMESTVSANEYTSTGQDAEFTPTPKDINTSEAGTTTTASSGTTNISDLDEPTIAG